MKFENWWRSKWPAQIDESGFTLLQEAWLASAQAEREAIALEANDRLGLIARLRSSNTVYGWINRQNHEAADEIERLRRLIFRACAELETVEYENDPPVRVSALIEELRAVSMKSLSFDRGGQRNENNEGDMVCN